MTQRAPHNDGRRKHLEMRLVSSRTIPFLDCQSLEPAQAREALFRTSGNRFILYLAGGNPSSMTEERVIHLDLREALIWLNEPSDQLGSFWS
jgi:hypothetical protein